MIKKMYSLTTVSVLFTAVLVGPSFGQERVVVIPLYGGGNNVAAVGDATADDVLTGKTFSGDAGIEISGTMADNGAVTITPSTSNQAVAVGYHNGSGTVVGDSNLTAENIKSDTDIFGVTGTYPLAAVAQTGQTTSYATSDDGYLGKGAALPNPRFTDNGNGTVTDNLTGLVWLQDANCDGTKDWPTALTFSNNLQHGECGLGDGSFAGDWRLPNVRELHSLIAWQYSSPALSNAVGSDQWTEDNDAFSAVQSNRYWSSTTYTHSTTTDYAWTVYLSIGSVNNGMKTENFYVWPVRD